MKISCVLCCLLAGCSGSSGDDYNSLPPVVHDDTVTLAEDTPLPFTQLAANDENLRSTDPITVVEAPEHGSIVEQGYVPNVGYHGPDRFTYQGRNPDYEVSDNTATVTIDVTSDGISYEQASKLDPSPANGIATGDLDGDGRIDIVTADDRSGTIDVLLNTTPAATQYSVAPMRFEGGRDPWDLQVADVDGDGHSDIVVAAGSDGVVFLKNRGTTPLELDAPLYRVAGDVTDIVLTDFNRDGKPDFAALDHFTDEVVVELNISTPGAIAFSTPFRFATPIDPIYIVAGDMDGAGGPDLMVLSPESSTVSLFVNSAPVGATAPAFTARIDRTTGTYPQGLVLADLDGDSLPEVAVVNDFELWIYANRSTGSTPDFVAARVLDLDVPATRISTFDIDGTGGPDLVIGSQGSPYRFLLNTSGAGGYSFDAHDAVIGDIATQQRAKLGDSGGIISANLDASGKPELLVTGTSGTFVLFD